MEEKGRKERVEKWKKEGRREEGGRRRDRRTVTSSAIHRVNLD